MYNNPNLGLLKESGMWDWVDIWNLLVLMADWQFMYLQAGRFPLAAGADAAVDVQPPSPSCAGGCAAVACPLLVQGSVLSGGLQSWIIKVGKDLQDHQDQLLTKSCYAMLSKGKSSIGHAAFKCWVLKQLKRSKKSSQWTSTPSLGHELLAGVNREQGLNLIFHCGISWLVTGAGSWWLPSPVLKPIPMSCSPLQYQSSHLSAQELGIVFYLRISEYGSSRNHVFRTISYFWKKTVNSSSM